MSVTRASEDEAIRTGPDERPVDRLASEAPEPRQSISVRTLLHNASSLVGTTVITSGLGAVFWWLAARSFDPNAIGVASAAVSAMTFLATVSLMGMGTMLIGELPKKSPSEAATLITTAMSFAGLLALILGAIFALGASAVSGQLTALSGTVWAVVLFSVGSAVTAGSLVFDQALIGLFRGEVQFMRNTAFAVIKLLILAAGAAVVSSSSSMTILATWVLATVISLLGVALYARRQVRLRPRVGALQGKGRLALAHHGFNLALQAPRLVLPVLTISILSATTNAHFYVAVMIASFCWMVPVALSTVLFAIGTGDYDELQTKLRFTLRLSALVAIASSVIFWVAAPQILHVFGPSYASEASWTLRILGLGTFPLAIKAHYVAVARVQRRLPQSMPVVLLGTALEIGMAALGASRGGLTEMSLGWLLGMMIEAVVMTPKVWRAAHRRGSHRGGERVPA
jgi:O-antigen/teichoic acid export membrane protein